MSALETVLRLAAEQLPATRPQERPVEELTEQLGLVLVSLGDDAASRGLAARIDAWLEVAASLHYKNASPVWQLVRELEALAQRLEGDVATAESFWTGTPASLANAFGHLRASARGAAQELLIRLGQIAMAQAKAQEQQAIRVTEALEEAIAAELDPTHAVAWVPHLVLKLLPKFTLTEVHEALLAGEKRGRYGLRGQGGKLAPSAASAALCPTRGGGDVLSVLFDERRGGARTK